jgi:hypothetical protein
MSHSDAQQGEVAVLVDPLDVGRDWLLDERLLVLGVGVPHPQVHNSGDLRRSARLDAGDVADREIRGVGAGGEAEGDLPIFQPRWEPEAPRKSTSPGAKPLNGRALTLPVRVKRVAL